MVMSPFLNSTACIEVRPATDAGRSLGLTGAPLAPLDGAVAVVSGVPDEHATSVTAAAVPTSRADVLFRMLLVGCTVCTVSSFLWVVDDSSKPVWSRGRQDLPSHVMAGHLYWGRSVVAWAHVQPGDVRQFLASRRAKI